MQVMRKYLPDICGSIVRRPLSSDLKWCMTVTVAIKQVREEPERPRIGLRDPWRMSTEPVDKYLDFRSKI
jgi:hypothetical protein